MSRSAKKEVAFIVSIVMLASSLVSLGPLSNQAQAGMTWLLETVTDQGGSKTVIDIDSAGNPWILYSGTTVATGLSLAHWNGFSWVLDVVAPGGGLCFSFALDDLNRPHVVYDGDDSPWPGLKDMHYAYWNGTSWVYETIDSQGDLGSTCSIALDPLGRPHVSYENYTWTAMNPRRDLKYAWRDSSGWHNETVDWQGWVGIGNSIAVDLLNRPHIAYEEYGNMTLKHAWWDGSTWRTEAVDSSGDVVPGTTSIRLDSLDRPHIAYVASVSIPTGEDRYASWNGVSWDIEKVTTVGTVGDYPVSLRLDSSDGPHIAFHNSTPGVSYAEKIGSSWVIENIDIGGMVGLGVSLGLDSGGNPHISYTDEANNLVRYAHRGMDSIPPSSTVNRINPYWSSSSRAITATATDGQGRVSNVTLWYRFSPDNASTSWGTWKAHQEDDMVPWYWIFTFPDGEGYYQFYSVAVDTGGNVEPPPPTADAIAAFEQTKPSSILQLVQSYWFNSTPLVLTATASDAPSGVDRVDLYYSFSGNNASWNAWTLYQTDRTPPWSWDFNFPMGAGWYRLYSLARDWAGNVEDTPATHDLELAFDRTPPTSMVNPISGGWHRSSVDVTAQARDLRSGVANVALEYRYSPDKVSWSPWTYFQTDSLPPWSWLFTFPDGDGFYQFHTIGTDNASNSEWFKDWPEANATYDATPPTALVDQSPPYWKNASAIPTATISDATSGVENATLWYRFSIDNSSWGSWQSFATDVSPPWSWLFDFPDGPGHYQLQATAFDSAGNEDPLNSEPEAEVGFDPDAPSASLAIGSPNVSNPPATWVTSSSPLTLTAYDWNGSGVAFLKQRAWRGGWSPWSDYSGPFTLTGTDGLRYLEFQAFDAAGNAGLVENRTIILDNTPPASTLSIGDPKYLLGGNFVTSSTPITLQANDGGTTPVGVQVTKYQVDGGGWNDYSSSFTLAGEATHTVEYYSRDFLTNQETANSIQIIVDDTPPATAIVMGEPKYLIGGPFIKSTTPISFSATDVGVGSNSTFYRLWDTIAAFWSSWGDISPTDLLLIHGDGTWYAEYLSYDYLGNIESVHNQTIVLDDTPPATTVAQSDLQATTDTVFSLTATDTGCGVNVTKYRIDGGQWLNYVLGFTLPEGTHNISYYSNDMLNNTEEERWLVVTVSGVTQPPSSDVFSQYWWLVVLIVAVVTVIAFFFLMKRRKPKEEEPPAELEVTPPNDTSR